MGLFTPAAWAAGTGCMTANDLSAIAIDGTSLTGGVTCTASNNGSVVIVGNGDGQVGSGTKEGISLAVRVDGSTGPIRNVISAVGSSNIASGGSTGTNVLDVRIGDSQAITNGTLRAFAGKISMGDATTLASGSSSQAIGASAIVAAAATNGTALGTGATVNSSDGVAIGTSSTVSTNAADSAAIGSGATVGDSAKQSIAFGKGATVVATDPSKDINQIAIGTGAQSTGDSSVVIGNSAKALSGSVDSVAIGMGASVGSTSNKVITGTALGAGSSVQSSGGTAIGGGIVNSLASGGIAIGNGAKVIVNGGTSIAIGTGANAGEGNYNIAIGRQSNVGGTGASAYGEGTTAVGDGTLALGQKANASLLVGSTWVAGGVALGSNSKVESAASTVSSAKVGNVNLSGFAGTVSGPGGQVSVGSTAAGGQRQIRNVAAGAITATSTDGINGSQLYSAATALTARTDTLGEDTAAALGGGASYDPVAGHLSAPSYTITKTDGTTYPAANNVGQALGNLNAEVIKPLTFTGTTGSTANKLGSTVAIIGDSKNITTAVTANQVKVQISDTPSFTSVTTGSSVLNTNGLTITGGPSVLVGGLMRVIRLLAMWHQAL
ncbi:beta strand repeat-containing protein [Acinetobacter sp.]|uniref:beta strand repeat-containing protein n=1 Tax=Acinetobacter sp. TaxID=472 RepID=UPI0035E3D44E